MFFNCIFKVSVLLFKNKKIHSKVLEVFVDYYYFS